MARLKEKIAYALGRCRGGIVWKGMSIAFPLFFINVLTLLLADAAVLMLCSPHVDVVTDPPRWVLLPTCTPEPFQTHPWLIYMPFLSD